MLLRLQCSQAKHSLLWCSLGCTGKSHILIIHRFQNFDFEIYRHDSVAKGTVEYADSHDIDLIIMFTHGRKGFERFLFGSIAEEVVNISDIPVLSIVEN